MDKQKQIEEMAYLICNMTSKCIDCSKHKCKSKKICIKLYNAGYRKIPEGAVVLETSVLQLATLTNSARNLRRVNMANLYARNNTDEYSTKVMMAYPITPLARMIGRCWFLGPEKLAERAGVTVGTVKEVLRGREIGKESERRIKEALGLCTNTKVSS